VTDEYVPTPFAVAGIRNFGWVEPGVVARGEQPTLDEATFRALYDVGIRAIVSLRPDREPPPFGGIRQWPEYHVEEEQRLAEQAGMCFRHQPLADFAAPPPDEVAAALQALDEEARTSPAVYVHCRAGAGRAAVVSGAWSVAGAGRSGDYAIAMYERFMAYVTTYPETQGRDRVAMLKRVRQPEVLWAMRHILSALGSPTTYQGEFLLPAERPAEADHWEQRYQEVLKKWRRGTLRSDG
jgi:protein tyrosine phosphatase (PTP) superfamily phosphohydrolase (DUF442 family)